MSRWHAITPIMSIENRQNQYSVGSMPHPGAHSQQSSVWHTIQLEQRLPEANTEPRRATLAVEHEKEDDTRAMTTCDDFCFPISFYSLVSVIPIAMLILGLISKNQCWMDSSIPDLLISLSFILFLHTLCSVFVYLIVKKKILTGLTAKAVEITTGIRIVGVTAIIFDIVSFALLITLSDRVFGIQTLSWDCSPSIQNGVFGVVIASWVAAGLHAVCALFWIISSCRQRASERRESHKTPHSTMV